MESLDLLPEIVTLKRCFAQFKVFVDYVERNGWQGSGGALADNVAFCQRMLDERDKLAAWLYRTGDMATTPRRSLIGRAAALYLAPDGMFDESARDKLAKDFRTFSSGIQKLKQAYDGAAPEQQIRLRDRILDEGIPGDPVVRAMWGKKKD